MNIKRINEDFNTPKADTITQIEDTIDKFLYQLADKAKRIISRMSPEQLSRFKSNYDETSRPTALLRYGLPTMKMLESTHYSNITKNASDVVADIKRIFHLSNFQVTVDDSYELGLPNIIFQSEPAVFEAIFLIIYDFEDNFKILDNYMNKSGYTLLRKFTPVFIDGNAIEVVIYTPVECKGFKYSVLISRL